MITITGDYIKRLSMHCNKNVFLMVVKGKNVDISIDLALSFSKQILTFLTINFCSFS